MYFRILNSNCPNWTCLDFPTTSVKMINQKPYLDCNNFIWGRISLQLELEMFVFLSPITCHKNDRKLRAKLHVLNVNIYNIYYVQLYMVYIILGMHRSDTQDRYRLRSGHFLFHFQIKKPWTLDLEPSAYWVSVRWDRSKSNVVHILFCVVVKIHESHKTS